MTTLKQLQENLQSALLENNARVLKNIAPSKTLSESQRLQIYQNSYHERIIGALRQDFPVLCAVLGESAFSSLITDYITTHPSSHYNLRYIGKNLSDFIISRDADFIAFSDLARLEWVSCEMEIDGVEKEFTARSNAYEVWQAFHNNETLPELHTLVTR